VAAKEAEHGKVARKFVANRELAIKLTYAVQISLRARGYMLAISLPAGMKGMAPFESMNP